MALVLLLKKTVLKFVDRTL